MVSTEIGTVGISERFCMMCMGRELTGGTISGGWFSKLNALEVFCKYLHWDIILVLKFMSWLRSSGDTIVSWLDLSEDTIVSWLNSIQDMVLHCLEDCPVHISLVSRAKCDPFNITGFNCASIVLYMIVLDWWIVAWNGSVTAATSTPGIRCSLSIYLCKVTPVCAIQDASDISHLNI